MGAKEREAESVIARKESKKEGQRLLVTRDAAAAAAAAVAEWGWDEGNARGVGKLPQTSVYRGRWGEVAINKYTEPAKSEGDGGWPSEWTSEQARRPTDRKWENDGNIERERGRERWREGERSISLLASVRSFVLASPKPYGPKPGVRTKKKRRDERATETSRL